MYCTSVSVCPADTERTSFLTRYPWELKSLFTISHVWWLEEFPLPSFCLHNPKSWWSSMSHIPTRPDFDFAPAHLYLGMMSGFVTSGHGSGWVGIVGSSRIRSISCTMMNSNNRTIIYGGECKPFKNKSKPNISPSRLLLSRIPNTLQYCQATLHRLNVVKGNSQQKW